MRGEHPTRLEWLGLTDIVAHSEFRQDRFVTALDNYGDTVRLAYVVRAVTPGTYDYPAAVVEDMYRPQFSARTASSRMQVVSAE